MWLQVEDSLNTRCEHLLILIFCIGFQTKFFDILLFCSVKKVFRWVQCVLSATFYVTAIILCYTKNIYKICNCKPHLESKFPNEYKGVPILWNTVYTIFHHYEWMVSVGVITVMTPWSHRQHQWCLITITHINVHTLTLVTATFTAEHPHSDKHLYTAVFCSCTCTQKTSICTNPGRWIFTWSIQTASALTSTATQ